MVETSSFQEKGEGEKLPEGGDDKQPAETSAGKLGVPCRKVSFYLPLVLLSSMFFL